MDHEQNALALDADAATPRRTLTLYLEEALVGDYLLTSQVRVRYLVHCHKPESLPGDDLPAVSTWEEALSTLDNHALMEFVNALQDACVGRESLFAVTVERGVSLWQFIICHLQPAIMRALGLVDVLNPLVAKTRPDVIALFPTSDAAGHLWQRTVEQVAYAHRAKVCVLAKRSPKTRRGFVDYSSPRSLSERLRLTVGRRCVAMASKLLAAWPVGDRIHRSSGKRLLFATSARHWIRVPGTREFYDDQFSLILPELRAAGWTSFVGLDCSHPPSRHTLRTLWERMRDPVTADVRWRAAVSYNDWHRSGEGDARLNRERTWQRIYLSPSFRDRLWYQGVPLLTVLADEFLDAMVHALPVVTDALLAAERIILVERPDAIMVTSEAVGLWERALVIQARRHGVPTVGLQHGMIFSNHYHYMHRSIATTNDDLQHGFHRPDVTCVWGPAWHDALTQSGHYLPSAVRVTGSWRYDTLATLPRQRSSSDMRAHLGIPQDKRIVLIVSGNQNMGTFVERCLRQLEHRLDCVTLVKPHPSDDIAAIAGLLRHSRYKDTVRLCTQVVEGLLAADVVISQISTVICEAAFWRRPVVLVDFEGVVGWDVYKQAGMCVQVTKESELTPAIDAVLSGQLPDSVMWRAQQEFSARYFLTPDGFAARRVVQVLATLVDDATAGRVTA